MNISKNLMLSFESHGYYLKVSSDVRDYFLKQCFKKKIRGYAIFFKNLFSIILLNNILQLKILHRMYQNLIQLVHTR